MQNSTLKLDNNGRVLLCARRTCCPSMEEDANDKEMVYVTDDEGGKIHIRKDQASLLGAGVNFIDENKQSDKTFLVE